MPATLQKPACSSSASPGQHKALWLLGVFTTLLPYSGRVLLAKPMPPFAAQGFGHQPSPRLSPLSVLWGQRWLSITRPAPGNQQGSVGRLKRGEAGWVFAPPPQVEEGAMPQAGRPPLGWPSGPGAGELPLPRNGAGGEGRNGRVPLGGSAELHPGQLGKGRLTEGRLMQIKGGVEEEESGEGEDETLPTSSAALLNLGPSQWRGETSPTRIFFRPSQQQV